MPLRENGVPGFKMFLTLNPLEFLTRSLLAGLLPFLHSGVTGEHTVTLQNRLQAIVSFYQRSGYTVCNSSGLTGNAASGNLDNGIILIGGFGEYQRLHYDIAQNLTGNAFFHRLAVYDNDSLALHQPPEELQRLMGLLIEEWKHQARSVMGKFGHEPGW